MLVFLRLPGEPFFSITRPFVQDTAANCLMLIFFYLNYYLLIPKLFFTHRYVNYVTVVLICLAFSLVIPEFIGRLIFEPGLNGTPPPFTSQPPFSSRPPQGPPPFPLDRPFFFFVLDELRRHLYLFFTAIFFSFLLKMREHLNQVKEEKLKSEIASLKSQINPHFLFNTLNSIYTLSVTKDDRASDAIIHLSGIMRYAIRDSHDNKIPLHKEIEYIDHYIQLQKSRLGDTALVVFQCSGDPGEKEIAPLILITYIENAFKHGISPELDDCMVEITIQITDEGILLHTYNKKITRSSYAEPSGIGLNNTNARLRHLYPGKHFIEIHENKESYSVNLSVHLS